MRLLPFFVVAACSAAPQAKVLRSGTINLTEPIRVAPGTVLQGHPAGTVLKMAPGFKGRALVEATSGSTVEALSLQGIRGAAMELAPSDQSFASFYSGNGILVEGAGHVTIRDVSIRDVGGYAVLVSASNNVTIERIAISDSGSLNSRGRNNTSGGILLEEGTSAFRVLNCKLRAVRGNGIWSHSRYTSPRNSDGVIEGNDFEDIGRDAVQVGHATRVQVRGNTGRRIGYPNQVVDYEGGGTPVGVDTAGNVDQSSYTGNRFDDISGKCIDLDGFHDGQVDRNVCTNLGHYGIVFNNTNPDMQSKNIRILSNTIDGAKYGGIFVIGSGHTITANRLLRLNQNGCPKAPNCVFDPKQPDMLLSGIYLGDHAERPESTRSNTIKGNTITGVGMKRHCLGRAAAVKLEEQVIQNNNCSDQ